MGYSVRSDSNDIFGKDNIDKWADLTNNGRDTEIDARIAWAIQEAYDQVNGRLYDCKYTVPFATTYDPIIVTLSARLVGVLLYDNRMLVDTVDFDLMANHRKVVEETYVKIHGGQIKLLNYTPKAVAYPQAIDSDADD